MQLDTSLADSLARCHGRRYFSTSKMQYQSAGTGRIYVEKSDETQKSNQLASSLAGASKSLSGRHELESPVRSDSAHWPKAESPLGSGLSRNSTIGHPSNLFRNHFVMWKLKVFFVWWNMAPVNCVLCFSSLNSPPPPLNISARLANLSKTYFSKLQKVWKQSAYTILIIWFIYIQQRFLK